MVSRQERQSESNAPARHVPHAVRELFRTSDAPLAQLARDHAVNPKTVAKWRSSGTVESRPPGPARGVSSKLSPREEQMIVTTWSAKPISLNAARAKLQAVIPHLTRSTLYRCLRRHGLEVRGSDADRARPNDGDTLTAKEQERQAILAIAERLFLTYGFEQTSMSAIASELGGSKARLWKHFRSKEELFGAFFQSAITSFNNELSATLRPDDPLDECVHAFVRCMLKQLFSPKSIKFYRFVLGARPRGQRLTG